MKTNRLSTVKSATHSAPKPTLRVSKNFHANIIERVTATCKLLPDGDTVKDVAITLINSYISVGNLPAKDCRKEAVMIFTLLKSEIDKAISRSQTARNRAFQKKSKTDTPEPTIETVGNDEIEPEPRPNRRQRRLQEQAQKRLNRCRIKPLYRPSPCLEFTS